MPERVLIHALSPDIMSRGVGQKLDEILRLHVSCLENWHKGFHVFTVGVWLTLWERVQGAEGIAQYLLGFKKQHDIFDEDLGNFYFNPHLSTD